MNPKGFEKTIEEGKYPLFLNTHPEVFNFYITDYSYGNGVDTIQMAAQAAINDRQFASNGGPKIRNGEVFGLGWRYGNANQGMRLFKNVAGKVKEVTDFVV